MSIVFNTASASISFSFNIVKTTESQFVSHRSWHGHEKGEVEFKTCNIELFFFFELSFCVSLLYSVYKHAMVAHVSHK